MTIVADTYQFVVGVDTHAATHTYTILSTPHGTPQVTRSFPASPAGIGRALDWISRHTNGPVLMAVECVGSYGAQLAHTATSRGYPVVEPFPTPPVMRRGKGKSDPVDARLIGASVLGVDTTRLRQPRTDQGIREALRVLISARDLMNKERTAAINALTALVRIAGLGVDARHHLSAEQIHQIGAWRNHPSDTVAEATARFEATRLARRVALCDTDLHDNEAAVDALVQGSVFAPLLDLCGVGPINAATVIIAWSHPGRVRDEAAFAALAGASPIPASSGNTTRYRLNRGGDRQLNRALTCIIRTRLCWDPATRDYQARRLAEGKTKREISRVLKRYLARKLYRQLTELTT